MEADNERLVIPGKDCAIVGVTLCHPSRTVYDRDKLIQAFHEDDGMTVEEAAEWVDFNIVGAYVGPHSPIVVNQEF
jgi:hypothetical protein